LGVLRFRGGTQDHNQRGKELLGPLEEGDTLTPKKNHGSADQKQEQFLLKTG